MEHIEYQVIFMGVEFFIECLIPIVKYRIMLNKEQKNNTDIKITACSGGIYKTYVKSWITRFHFHSPLADKILKEDSDIIIIQMVICGDMEVMAELIRKEDFLINTNPQINNSNQ